MIMILWIEKLEDIISDQELEKLVESEINIEKDDYDEFNSKIDELLELEMEKKIYKELFNHIIIKLTNNLGKNIKFEPKKLSVKEVILEDGEEDDDETKSDDDE